MYAGPREISAPPELLQTPPVIDAPIHEDPMTECVCRPTDFAQLAAVKARDNQAICILRSGGLGALKSHCNHRSRRYVDTPDPEIIFL